MNLVVKVQARNGDIFEMKLKIPSSNFKNNFPHKSNIIFASTKEPASALLSN